MNGIGDHIHIALDLNPSIALADLVRDIKRSTSEFMNPANGYPLFEGWGRGYYAATFSRADRDSVISIYKGTRRSSSPGSF
ncbi:MAG: transposase [Muribaculaceae bacterium]|nr:transposase [Muribaculaceae bacterium]